MINYDKNIDFNSMTYFDSEGNILKDSQNPIFKELNLITLKDFVHASKNKKLECFLKHKLYLNEFNEFIVLGLIMPLIFIYILFFLNSTNLLLGFVVILAITALIIILSLIYQFFDNCKYIKTSVLNELNHRKDLAVLLKNYEGYIKQGLEADKNLQYLQEIFLIINDASIEIDRERIEILRGYLNDCIKKSPTSLVTGKWISETLENEFFNNTVEKIHSIFKFIEENPQGLSDSTLAFCSSVKYFSKRCSYFLHKSVFDKLFLFLETTQEKVNFIHIGNRIVKHQNWGLEDNEVRTLLEEILDFHNRFSEFNKLEKATKI